MTSSRHKAFQVLLDEMPAADADFFAVLSWGQRFNAYDRWGSGPGLLHDLVLPLRNAYELTGTLPAGSGVDAVRALMFFKCREHHFTDCPQEEVVAMFQALRSYVESSVRGGDADESLD